MKNYFLIQHSRGNHSPEQIFAHGKIIIEGTKTTCKKELISMRKFCRNLWHKKNTNQKITEFVNYTMGDIFCIEVEDNQPIFFY